MSPGDSGIQRQKRQGAGIEKLIRSDLSRLKAYQPIIPPDVLSERAGIPVERVIKLDGNENPYGCSPRVGRALAGYPFYHIYPDPEQNELRKALAVYVGVDAAHIVAGAGSDELIDLILRLFLEPGDRVINCVPTFGMYPFCTEVCGGKVIDVPRDKSYAIDIEGIKEAVDEKTKVIFVTSPNNPTGNTTPQRDILDLVELGKVVVIDEAYYEFSGITVAPLVPQCENLIVLRSFSKWAGLAGLRIGYGVFSSLIAEQLLKIKQPYNINLAAHVALQESLADIEYLHDTVKKIISERERLFARLGELEFLKPLPSQSNFILCTVKKGDARVLYERLSKRGIFLRYFDTPLLRNSIRISVGKPEHTDTLIEALKEMC
ncbi:MAG: histidinol-phosphate transaminase [Dehalococcoidia bacterium]|nr:histidinol-phosphate transaminase [Dehalococcoidia bacterium]